MWSFQNVICRLAFDSGFHFGNLLSFAFPNSCRVTFIIAFVLLLSGAALNDQWGQERMYFGEYCYVVRSGVFSGGAVLSLASVALGIVYYVSSSSPKNMQPWSPQKNQGIALGQPQITPQAQTTPNRKSHMNNINRRIALLPALSIPTVRVITSP
ncbi:hypothetical protein C4D60_Mb09t20000 [Musa balbisiana]|uniref:Uncharacterized protein n=1 Tax=Musa balbisiana TaxID=52838 RepID=A0A4S8IHS6_MUSBA|nr:hypothetical protein C4D60_Mb09t20000 [Musa balbisiana]